MSKKEREALTVRYKAMLYSHNETAKWEGYVGLKNGGTDRSRTGVHGVAIRCIATLPPRLIDCVHDV